MGNQPTIRFWELKAQKLPLCALAFLASKRVVRLTRERLLKLTSVERK
jgi:hypothetical protein